MKQNFKKYFGVFGILAIVSISGCEGTPEEIAQKQKEFDEKVAVINKFNEKSLENPVVVGATKNGKIVTVAHLQYPNYDCRTCYPYDHYVYMVDGTTSDNYEYRSGKTRKQKVEVFLNDKPTPEQVIAEAERLKNLIEENKKLE